MAPPEARTAGRDRGDLRLEVKLTPLARPPSPAQLEAITTAVQLALGAGPVVGTAPPSRWRFSGRWWQPPRSGPGGQPPS